MPTNLAEFITSLGVLFISKVMIASIQAQLKAVSTVFRRPELPFRQFSVVFRFISLACILLRVLAEAGAAFPGKWMGNRWAIIWKFRPVNCLWCHSRASQRRSSGVNSRFRTGTAAMMEQTVLRT